MSTVIAKGVNKGVSSEAESWLAATDLAGNHKAALQLSRAVDPARHGFARRRPLSLDCSVERAESILNLLRAEQVPSTEAVEALERCPRTDRRDAERQARHEQFTRAKELVRAERHVLGQELSSAVAAYWAQHGIGPKWREAWMFDAVTVWWTRRAGCVPPFWLVGETTFGMLHRSGWLASNHATHSLCQGRRFYTRFHGDHVSAMPPTVVGFGVARFIGMYRRLHEDRSPDWAEVAAEATDPTGMPLFFNTADAEAQQRWLVTEGWVRLDDHGLRRGARARAEIRRRTELKAKNMAPASTSR